MALKLQWPWKRGKLRKKKGKAKEPKPRSQTSPRRKGDGLPRTIGGVKKPIPPP